jgi:hypothetical protein
MTSDQPVSLIEERGDFVDCSEAESLSEQSAGLGGHLLYATHAWLQYMTPPLYGSNQRYCGPRDEDIVRDGYLHYFKVPLGLYDIVDELARRDLPHPDVFIAHIDAAYRNLPLGLERLKSTRVMVLGDTHHLEKPLQKVIRYFDQEPYDLYLSDCKRHHDHFFQTIRPDARIEFFPGLRNRFEARRFVSAKYPVVSMIGALKGEFHPIRAELHKIIQQADVPLIATGIPQRQAAAVYSNALININCSLNSEMNMRVMEVISAGGLLLTDKLAPETGIDQCFVDGEHYLSYRSPQDCVATIRELLAKPQRALRIARAGWERFRERYGICQRRQLLANLVAQVRSSTQSPAPPQIDSIWRSWIPLYEAVQECNRSGINKVQIDFPVPVHVQLWFKPLARLKVAYDHSAAPAPNIVCPQFSTATRDSTTVFRVTTSAGALANA